MTAITNTQQASMLAPVPKPETYSAGDIILALFKEKIKDVVKATGYLAFWATKAAPDLPPSVANFNLFASRDVKNFISVIEMPEKLRTYGISVKNFITSLAAKVTGNPEGSWAKVGATAHQAFIKDGPAVVVGVKDSVDFGGQFFGITLPAQMGKTLGVAGFSATALSSGSDLLENANKIYTENKGRAIDTLEKTKTPLYVIRAISSIAYVALGAIGISGLVFGAAVAPWMFVSCLSVGVTCSIGGFFYEKLYDPECKGLNLKASVVAENVARQRAHEARTARANA